MLLVDGLPAHAEADRDLLPGPALVAGALDLQRLQPLGQLAQGPHGPQAHRGVPAARLLGERHSIAHGCQCRLTAISCQPTLTGWDASADRQQRGQEVVQADQAGDAAVGGDGEAEVAVVRLQGRDGLADRGSDRQRRTGCASSPAGVARPRARAR